MSLPAAAFTVGPMFVLAAEPWTYWIAPVITLAAVVGTIAVLIGYLVKVVAAKYPKQ